jgi:hypothetical protein
MSKGLKRVINLLTSIKAITAVIAGTSYGMENTKLGFWVLVGGAVVNEMIEFLKKEQNETI